MVVDEEFLSLVEDVVSVYFPRRPKVEVSNVVIIDIIIVFHCPTSVMFSMVLYSPMFLHIFY